jgi:PTS system cellobiose-specific IIC component
LTPVLRRIADAAPLVAVRESLPWSLAGLVAGLILFMALMPGTAILKRFTLAELPAFGVMAAALALILAYRLARRLAVSPAIATSGATLAFLLALPRPIAFGEPLAYLRVVGESGLLLAIVVAIVTCYACACARLIVPSTLVADTAGAAAIVIAAAACFDAHVSLGNALIGAMHPLGKLGDTYTALLLITIAETLLWLIGIHGPAVLAAVITPIYVTLQMQNTEAFAAHRPLPHIVVVSLFLFVFPGGAGATLPLAAMLATSKAERLRKIGRVSVLPALFNISEPLLFGLPIVFNPFLAIPFVLVPVTLATITYLAIAHGFVDAPWQYVPSALPSFFATYLATFDVRAVLLVIVNIVVATALYFPFFRALERDALRA